MMILYLIPALGADFRLFSHLTLPNYEKRVLPKLTPEKNESLEHYAKRLILHIDQSKPVVLIGCSLGGILAIEIAKQIKTRHIIIISSIKTRLEMDWRFAILRVTKLHRLFPYQLLKGRENCVINYMMGIGKNDELFYKMLKESDWRFTKWAVNQVIHWKNDVDVSAFHIHGKEDRIFLASKISNATFIRGGHFLIVQQAKLIEPHLLAELERNTK